MYNTTKKDDKKIDSLQQKKNKDIHIETQKLL